MGIGIGGLGSIAGGISSGMNDAARLQLLQAQAQQARMQQQSQGVSGQMLAGANGWNMPSQPQSPMGGLLGQLKGLLGGGSAQPPVAQPQAPQQTPQQPMQLQGAVPQQPSGSFMDALAAIESGNKNIPSAVDQDVAGPGTKSQGYFQINTPTWQDFASKVPGAAQYPNAMSAPREVQAQVAAVIPLSHFGPRTQTLLQKQFGDVNLHSTVGELNAKYGGQGGGQGQGQPQGGPPQGRPPGPGQIQVMSLSDLVQAAKRADPNMSPQMLMAAIGNILPIMNTQAQQQYHALMAQVAGLRANTGAQNADERARHDVADETLKQQALSQKGQEFKVRNDRLVANADRKFELETQKFQNAKDNTEKKRIRDNAKSVVDEQYRAERQRILIQTSTNLKTKDKQVLLEEAKQRHDLAMDTLDSAMVAEGSAAPGGSGPQAGAPPAGGQAPAGGDIVDDGTGKLFKYKGSGDRKDQKNYAPYEAK